MAYKTSSALLAAIVAIAGPAFAQDSTTPAPIPETAEAAAQDAADSANQAADAAATAADEAATAVEGAAADAEAAADAASDAADAAVDAATAAGAETTETPADTAAEPAAETTDAAAAAEAPADGAAPAEAATTDAAAAAQPATPAEPQVGAYFVKATHGDWTIRCINADEGLPDPCELYQLLKDEAGNSVAEVTLIPLTGGEAAAGATIVAPLETDLVRGLGLQIDAAAPRGYPFNFCAPVGCVARMGFDGNGLAGLKRGNKATVSLLPFGADPEQPVQLPMSLAGFTAGFTELEGIVAEAEEQIAAARAAAEATPDAEAATEGDAAPADAPAETAAEGEAAPATDGAAETAPSN